MTLPSYSTGTVSVTNGSSTVTGSGTIWTGGNVSEGDDFVIGGYIARVVAIVSATQLTITPWPGATLAGSAYKIYQNSPRRFTDVQIADDLRKQVQALNLINYFIPVQDSQVAPDPSLGDENQRAFQDLTGKWWKKEGGVWNLKGSPYGLQPAANLGDVQNAASARTNLGLPLQASPTDTTDGRVLTVGAFGAGAPIILVNADAFADRPSGSYFVSGAGSSNRPIANDGYLDVTRLDANNSLFRFRQDTSANEWIAVKSGNIISGWFNVGTAMTADRAFRRANVLGTVTQSGGVPTGALIEAGSNAGGVYAKFADGTQICWMIGRVFGTITNAVGSVFNGTPVQYGLPASFPSDFAAFANTDSTNIWGVANPFGLTAITVNLFCFTTIGSSRNINAIAIGRWF